MAPRRFRPCLENVVLGRLQFLDSSAREVLVGEELQRVLRRGLFQRVDLLRTKHLNRVL